MKANIKDRAMLLFWLFEAQYQIMSELEGQFQRRYKQIFNNMFKQHKRFAAEFRKPIAEIEADRKVGKDALSDDLFNSGEAIVQFVEKYIEAEQKGREDSFMAYMKNWN